MPPFVVFSLPRSRSVWLSKYLQVGDWLVTHDEARHVRSLDDVRSFLSMPYTGTVETSASPFWRLIQEIRPDIRTVVIRRPVADVVQSMVNLGFQFDLDVFTRLMKRFDAKLDQIEHRVPDVLSIQYDDLNDEQTVKHLFEYLTGYPHDHQWWSLMAPMNIQMPMVHAIRYFQAFESQLSKVSKIAKYQMLASMSRGRVEIDHDDGITIQEESFEKAYMADAKALIADHCIAGGESPDLDINYDLLQKMADLNGLQVMTARSNGKLRGYLLTIVGPSLEHSDQVSAAQSAFFCSPDFKGLGWKLELASIAALKAKGVHEVYLKAGVRADGSRLGTMYRRLGASHFGEVFKLDLS